MSKKSVMSVLFMLSFATIVSIVLFSTSVDAEYIDECSQFASCGTCLNVDNSTGQGGRNNCGWCHFDVQYVDGGTGKQCADIRDKPWTCRDLYDTYKCSVGYYCDFDEGQCKMSGPGQGFGNISTCEEHCFRTPDSYKCNTTSYQCEVCDRGDTTCYDKTTACGNCVAPPTRNYRCNRDDPDKPQCVICEDGESGCQSRGDACNSCNAPQKQYKCDEDKLQCVETEHGLPQGQCEGTCTNSTPTALYGEWRGIEVHKGFAQGEVDYKFSEEGVAMKMQNGDVSHASVSQTPGVIRMTMLDGPNQGRTMKGFMIALNNGQETEAYALNLGDFDQDAPHSLEQAMEGDLNRRVHLLSRCNSWKGECDFSSIFSEFRSFMNKQDSCNAFLSCSECINADTNGINCGWCMGGTVVYNDTGDSGFHCAGFEDGTPFAFTCSPEFRTTDCSGYNCDWNATQPMCMISDIGEYPTADACDSVCHTASFAKCNTATKQCEPCNRGDPDCIYTADTCDAHCKAVHAKCDYMTQQCSICDPASDPDCVLSKGDCDYKCGIVHGVCDPNSGTCYKCDPTKGTPGCVVACDDTCSYVPVDTYSCDWNADTPTCKMDANGTLSKEQCTSWCVATVFSKCNEDNGKCYVCDHSTDPDCIFPQANCEASCKKKPTLTTKGLWRGIMINRDFHRGEFVFKFSDDNTATIVFTNPETGELHKLTADIQESDTQLEMTFTTVSDTNNPFGAVVGDVVKGLYQENGGWEKTFQFLYMAFGDVNQDTPSDFDDGMNSLEFVLASCSGVTGRSCDFSSIDPSGEIILESWN